VKEYAIGERFDFDGETYETVVAETKGMCHGCDFFEKDCGSECLADYRKDGAEVIFKKVFEGIRVKKFSDDLPDLEIIDKGDWIDLYTDRGCPCFNDAEEIEYAQKEKTDLFKLCNDSFHYEKGDVVIIGTGVAMELPEGHEAHVVPRSSTFKKYGLLLTNSKGIIDNLYCGDNDEWQGMFYATRSGVVNRFDRLLQFKVVEKMKKPAIEYVKKLGNEDRNGYGTTGR